MFFLCPYPTQGGVSIPVAHLAHLLTQKIHPWITEILLIIFWLSSIGSIAASLFLPKTYNNAWISKVFCPGYTALCLRLLGACFLTQCYLLTGPDFIYSPSTGLLLYNDLLPILLSVFILAGILLPLLLDFGLLEFVGTLASKVMRPLFNLPGRSAIDCLTSWLGDGSVGVILTSKQYEQGYYTQKEAAIIATNFSAVSITFSLIVLSQVNLGEHFFAYYLTVCLCGIICALILPRIPPLSRKKSDYADSSHSEITHDIQPSEGLIRHAYQLGLEKAKSTNILESLLINGCKNIIEIVFGLLPIVMAIGTGVLVIAEYTAFFDLLGKPFIPLLELLHIPEAKEASKTLLAGFSDMFLPSIIGAPIQSPITRFFIATLSVTQLIYLSEVGALILGSKIPLSFIELCMIFLLRTFISMPIIALVAHLYF